MPNTKIENENGNVVYDNEEIYEPVQLRKLFIGGLDYRTTHEGLKSYFEKWGRIVEVDIKTDSKTKRSRGFGFITYSQSYMVDKAQNARSHKIDGRIVETKRALARQDFDSPNAGATIKKLFVGCLRDDHDKECLYDYFKNFGNIMGIKMVSDKETGKNRGFAFIDFDDYDSVDKIILQKNHTIKNKALDVKKAIVKRDMGRPGQGGGVHSARNNNLNGLSWGSNRQIGGNWGSGRLGNNRTFGGNNQGGVWNIQPQPWNNQGGSIHWNALYCGSYYGVAGWNNVGSGGGNFGYGYQQSYGGGPQRNNFGNIRSVPYNQGGFNKVGN